MPAVYPAALHPMRQAARRTTRPYSSAVILELLGLLTAMSLPIKPRVDKLQQSAYRSPANPILIVKGGPQSSGEHEPLTLGSGGSWNTTPSGNTRGACSRVRARSTVPTVGTEAAAREHSMKRHLHVATVIITCVAASALAAQHRQAHSHSAGGGQCPALRSQYLAATDAASRYMAASEAGVTGQDAETKQANALSRARMVIDVMKSASCSVPPIVASSEKYMPAARGCARSQIMSRYGGDPSAGCDPGRWQSYSPPK